MNFASIMFFTNQVFHLERLFFFCLLLILEIVISSDQISTSGFPKWGRIVGAQFWNNDQKLQGNFKINIFAANQ